MGSFPGKVIGVLLCFILLVFAPISITVVTQNIRTERLIWNALTYYTDVVTDKGIMEILDYEDFIAKLGASMVDFEVTISVQRKEILPSNPPGSGYTVRHTTYGVWKNSTGGVSESVYLYAGDNVQVILKPISNTQADGFLSQILGLHITRMPITYASNVRNDGYSGG